VPAAALATRVAPDRTTAASLAVGAVGACALLAVVDPEDRGLPLCPTSALLGIDCPACGTLRGLHALFRGQPGQALDHNLLLLAAVPLGLILWVRWVATALGRPAPARPSPRWLAPAAIGGALVFAILRNLPGGALPWLASGA
jgi:hypothetical protein